MAFCPCCGNDTYSLGKVYTPEHGLWENCFDECDFCGYREDYDCPEYDNADGEIEDYEGEDTEI